MELDPATDCTDSKLMEMATNGITSVEKRNISARLAPKQLEMDWEEESWTRSVRQCGNDVRVTIKF